MNPMNQRSPRFDLSSGQLTPFPVLGQPVRSHTALPLLIKASSPSRKSRKLQKLWRRLDLKQIALAGWAIGFVGAALVQIVYLWIWAGPAPLRLAFH